MQSNGLVLYRGPSMLDGAPIVVIAVGLKSGSTNSKTGEMVQTYILRADTNPIEATQTGQDSSICGDCVHRGTVKVIDGQSRNVGRTCYVNLGQGPLAVYKTFLQGKYPDWDGQTPVGQGKFIRLGTYGDPAAVPATVWQSLLRGSSGHTGYTHQWNNAALPPDHVASLRTLCMASADTADEADRAHAMGWRTFRVSLGMERDPMRKGEVLCPASAEAGRKLKCSECLACGGADGRRSSIYIPAHGGFAVMANVRRRAA